MPGRKQSNIKQEKKFHLCGANFLSQLRCPTLHRIQVYHTSPQQSELGWVYFTTHPVIIGTPAVVRVGRGNWVDYECIHSCANEVGVIGRGGKGSRILSRCFSCELSDCVFRNFTMTGKVELRYSCLIVTQDILINMVRNQKGSLAMTRQGI